MPLLIAPLLEVDRSGGEGLHGFAFPVQQLDADLVLAATVPARRVPEDKRLRSPVHRCLASRPYSPVRHPDVRLEGVQQGRAVSFFSQIYELRLQAPSADTGGRLQVIDPRAAPCPFRLGGNSLIRRDKVVLDRLVRMWEHQPLGAPSVATVGDYLPELQFIYRNQDGTSFSLVK